MQFVILMVIFNMGCCRYRLKDDNQQVKSSDTLPFLNFKSQPIDPNEQIVEIPFKNLLNMLDKPIFQNQFENMKMDQSQNTGSEQNIKIEQNIRPQNSKDIQQGRLSNKCIINNKYQCSVCCLSNNQCGNKQQCENSAYNRRVVDMMTISLFSFFIVIYIVNFYSHSGLLPKQPIKKLN